MNKSKDFLEDIPYYPDYAIWTNNNNETVVQTILRKEYNNKWYIISVSMKTRDPGILMKEFHEEIYHILICSKINDNTIVDSLNHPIIGWKLDELQISEKERLMKL